MSDLKEFFMDFESKVEDTCRHADLDENTYGCCVRHLKGRLFDFHWNRGGKQFVLGRNEFNGKAKWYKKFEFDTYYNDAKKTWENQSNWAYLAQDFLDCVGINKKKVKELIGELE